jgi:membrane-bound serine protease (ClpP class)
MTALLVGFFVFIGASVLHARLRRPYSGREGLIGSVGAVRRALDPDGMVFVNGEFWQATAADGATDIPVGRTVTVAAIDGLRLVVRPATATEAAGAGVVLVDESDARSAATGSEPPPAAQPVA